MSDVFPSFTEHSNTSVTPVRIYSDEWVSVASLTLFTEGRGVWFAVTLDVEDVETRLAVDGVPLGETASDVTGEATIMYPSDMRSAAAGWLFREAPAGEHYVEVQARRKGGRVSRWEIVATGDPPGVRRPGGAR